jgi:amino acid transporter
LAESSAPRLRRALTLRDLIFYGIVCIQPTAPMPPFGAVAVEARGHVVTTILIALVAMLFTAVSYGRMSRVYPSAGSSYSYIAGEFGATAGFVTGWSILLDYLLNPLICVIWSASAAANLLPQVPSFAWKIFFALLFTLLNLRGIEASARTTRWLAIGMSAVVAYMLAMMARYIYIKGNLELLRPFYDPETFSWAAVSTGTSIAALTYIGFDTISTLSEEAVNPKRDILRATVLVCFLIGVISAIEVYFGQLVYPDYNHFPDVDTAYVFVAGRAGGPFLFHLVNVTLLVATVGSGMSAQLGGARLLYGMGSQGALPRFFTHIDPRTSIPARNVILCGAISLAGAWAMDYQLGAELLNFGAFLAFIGVNLASFWHYWVKKNDRSWHQAVLPLLGAAVCFYIWASLRWQAKAAGGVWLLLGLTYLLVQRARQNRTPTLS